MRSVILTMCIGSLRRPRRPRGSVDKHLGSDNGYVAYVYDGACWSRRNYVRPKYSWMCFTESSHVPFFVYSVYIRCLVEYCEINAFIPEGGGGVMGLCGLTSVCLNSLAFYKTKWLLLLKQALCIGVGEILLTKGSNSNCD